MSTAPVRFQLRRGTAAQWISANPILALGEPGIETDTVNMKFGDGVTHWIDLPYAIDSAFHSKYIINPPPAPVGLTVDTSSNSQYINIYWQYPPQINVGLNEAWLPYITGLGAQLEGVSYNGLSNQTVVLPTSNASFVNAYNGGSNPILLLQLSPFGSGTTGPTTITIGSTTYVGLIIRDSGFASMTTSGGQIRVWYKNYNTNSGTASYSSTAGPLSFNLAKSGPTTPTNLAAVDSGFGANGKNNETISFTKSAYANNANPSDTNATVTTYQYTYTLQSTSSRYGGAISDTGTVTITVTSQSQSSYSSTTLFNPGSIYSISLTGTNNYSLTSNAATLTTAQTNFPIAPSSTSFSMPARYYSSIVKILDSSITSQVLNLYTSWSSSSFIVPVHTTSNRGSTASSLSTLVYSITGGALAGSPGFPTITFNGFGVSPLSVISGSTTLLTPTVVSVLDTYSYAPSQGFYLQGTNSFTVDLTNTTNFKNSNVLYTLSANAYTTTFYYDSISGAPTVTPTIVLGTNTTTTVSGIAVYGSTEAFTIQLLCGNMGDYFCPQKIGECKVKLVDSADSTTAYGPNKILGIADVSNDTIVSGVFKYGGSTVGNVKIAYSDSESLDTYAVATVSIQGYVYNIVTPSGTSFDSSSTSTVKIIIDQPSITLLSTIPSLLPVVGASNSFVIGRSISSTSTFNATTYVPNWYATTSDTSYGNVGYDHNALLTATGNYELLVANGKFRTWGTGTYYRDYTAYTNPNYSGIVHTGLDFRFATFAWKVDLGSGSGNGISFNRIAFAFNNAKTNSLSFNGTNGTAYITGTSVYPLIYYRFEQQLYTGTDYRKPNGSTSIGANRNYTTDWININAITVNGVNSSNYNNLTSTDTSPYVKSGFNGVSTTPNGDGTVTYTFTPKLGYADTIPTSTFLYCRIILPMNVDFEFASISANLYSA